MLQMTDYAQFCKTWLDAWTGNKPAALVVFYSDDAFYSDPAKPVGLNGKTEILKYFEKLLSKNPDWKWEVVEIFPTEKGFTLKWKATIPTNETSLTICGLDIVEMRDDLISRNEVYFDRTAWIK